VTSPAESLYGDIQHFVGGSPSGLLQLLVAAAGRATFARIISCPTYPVPTRTAGLSLAIRQLREAMIRPDVHVPTFLARLHASTRGREYRKRAGQFFTAAKVAEWALGIDPPRTTDDVVDAGAGTAVFGDTIARLSWPVRSYVAVENDIVLTLCAAHVLEGGSAPHSFKVWYANFLLLQEASFGRQGLRCPTLIIANPPFVRAQRLVGRARILASIKSALGIRLAPMSGSGSYFLARAASLAGSARSSVGPGPAPRLFFFSPSEVAGAAHAKRLREDLRRVHDWTWREHVITDNQTGIDKHPSNALALFFVFERRKAECEPIARGAIPRIRVRDVLQIKRGISTGCNDFFVLTDDEARRREISQDYLRAVMPTRIPLPSRCFSKGDWNELRRLGHRCWLLTLPNQRIEAFERPIQDYLRIGLQRGLHSTPTARKLRTWFSLPIPRTAPDVFVTYLFRGSPRFVLNQSKVLHLTNILGGRFVSSIEDSSRQLTIIDGLNVQAKRWMEKGMPGREYRDGLKKIEPRELSMLPMESAMLELETRGCPGVPESLEFQFD
jgi:hypothetical protein